MLNLLAYKCVEECKRKFSLLKIFCACIERIRMLIVCLLRDLAMLLGFECEGMCMRDMVRFSKFSMYSDDLKKTE